LLGKKGKWSASQKVESGESFTVAHKKVDHFFIKKEKYSGQEKESEGKEGFNRKTFKC